MTRLRSCDMTAIGDAVNLQAVNVLPCTNVYGHIKHEHYSPIGSATGMTV